MIIGNFQAIRLLARAVEINRVSSAYLFVGIDGIGKSLAAKYFIQKIFECDELTNHPDLLWIKSENSKSIKIDAIRKIPEFISSSPMQSSRNIVVIEDAHLMGEPAANALLKVVEEPGEKTTIILIADNRKPLFSTIVSRCHIIGFFRLSKLEVKQVLESTGYQLEDDFVLGIAEGSPGQAIKHIKMMQQIDNELIKRLVQPIGSVKDVMTLGKDIAKKLKDKSEHLWLMNYLQRSHWQKNNAYMVAEIEKSKSMIENNVQSRLIWECLLLKMV